MTLTIAVSEKMAPFHYCDNVSLVSHNVWSVLLSVSVKVNHRRKSCWPHKQQLLSP